MARVVDNRDYEISRVRPRAGHWSSPSVTLKWIVCVHRCNLREPLCAMRLSTDRVGCRERRARWDSSPRRLFHELADLACPEPSVDEELRIEIRGGDRTRIDQT
jgi:hypothetical protein